MPRESSFRSTPCRRARLDGESHGDRRDRRDARKQQHRRSLYPQDGFHGPAVVRRYVWFRVHGPHLRNCCRQSGQRRGVQRIRRDNRNAVCGFDPNNGRKPIRRHAESRRSSRRIAGGPGGRAVPREFGEENLYASNAGTSEIVSSSGTSGSVYDYFDGNVTAVRADPDRSPLAPHYGRGQQYYRAGQYRERWENRDQSGNGLDSTAAVSIDSRATFRLDNFAKTTATETIAGVMGSGSVVISLNKTLELKDIASPMTFSGVVSDVGRLTKSGSGTQTPQRRKHLLRRHDPQRRHPRGGLHHEFRHGLLDRHGRGHARRRHAGQRRRGEQLHSRPGRGRRCRCRPHHRPGRHRLDRHAHAQRRPDHQQ